VFWRVRSTLIAFLGKINPPRLGGPEFGPQTPVGPDKENPRLRPLPGKERREESKKGERNEKRRKRAGKKGRRKKRENVRRREK